MNTIPKSSIEITFDIDKDTRLNNELYNDRNDYELVITFVKLGQVLQLDADSVVIFIKRNFDKQVISNDFDYTIVDNTLIIDGSQFINYSEDRYSLYFSIYGGYTKELYINITGYDSCCNYVETIPVNSRYVQGFNIDETNENQVNLWDNNGNTVAVQKYGTGGEVTGGDTVVSNDLQITDNVLTSTIVTDKDTFTSEVTLPNSEVVTETDPIYMADKPSIALKSELTPLDTRITDLEDKEETDPIYLADKPSLALKTDVSTAITDNNANYYTKSEIDLLPKPDNVTDVSLNLTGSDLKATVTTDSNTYESNTVTLPSGGDSVYYESTLLASVEIGTSESNPGFVTNNVSFPEIGSVTKASLNIQCEVTRTGGSSALGVVTIIVTGKDSSFHNIEIFRFNKEIARDITKVAIPLHSKRYDLSAYSGVRYQGFYTGTGTVTLENVTAWVE